MSYYRILSLDGGGIRGYLTILLLEQLEKSCPGFLQQIDLFAGTSTGSIIALALASGKSPAEIRELYERFGHNIFHSSLVDNLRDLGFALGAKYSNEPLKRILKSYFGDDHLYDLKKRVLITSFDLDCEPTEEDKPRMWKAKFFHNYPGVDSDSRQRIVNVAMRSSAAPFYFPSYQGYVDGFVVANNPSMCALAQALDTAEVDLKNIVLLSVGTGLNPRYIDDKDTDWGWVKWMIQLDRQQQHLYALPLVYMMWEGGVDLANYQCKHLIHDRFHRLDPVLTELVDIDEVDKMDRLEQIANDAKLEKTEIWIGDYFDLAEEIEQKLANLRLQIEPSLV